jgi:two-component system NtrC family response regulator
MPNILIIDTHESFVTTLCKEITQMGHQSDVASTLAEGLALAENKAFDVVFLNAEMPDGKGVEALPRLVAATGAPEVILLADSGHSDEAELAIKKGAWDYLERPSTARAIDLSLVRALQYRAKRIHKEPDALLKRETFEDIVGSSPQMKQCLNVLALAANSDANVLITGETGTGKELFAWAIHNNSRRANRRFVVVDCAALPETLVESTLFGYEKGAFTGADKAQSGLIKRADGGTLFLDEVGEMPLSVQKSFLRVLQEKRYRQVGGGSEIRSDFRLIAASNRNLDGMVQRRHFRKDLLFRLRAFAMELPPLRERMEDIRELVTHHTARLCTCYGFEEKTFSPDFFEVLHRYDWPGNVRELANALERAISAAGSEPVIYPKHLPTYVRVRLARATFDKEHSLKANQESVPGETGPPMPSLQVFREAAVAEAEQRYLKELMTQASDREEACRISELSRSRLYALLKKYRLPSFFRKM